MLRKQRLQILSNYVDKTSVDGSSLTQWSKIILFLNNILIPKMYFFFFTIKEKEETTFYAI